MFQILLATGWQILLDPSLYISVAKLAFDLVFEFNWGKLERRFCSIDAQYVICNI